MPKYTKKIASPTVDMETLPGDILSNIFICLLAKQLAQMRCVCKSWNALLSEANFVKSHLQHSIHNNNDEILLFFKRGISFDYSPCPFTARSSRSPYLELTNFMKLKLPVDPHHKDAFGGVIGSVNGLICYAYASNNDCFIRIWNPSLSVSLTLPPSSLSYNGELLGFGFDPKTDDYKVVRVACTFNKVSMQPQGEVYSMRNGSWKLISHSVPSHIKNFIDRHEVYLDGHIHWVCVTYNLECKQQTIMTFDLGAMTFGEIPLPDSIVDLRWWSVNELGVLGGKLCLMSCVRDGECQVWMMDDDKLWVKHHAFSQFSYRISPYRFTSQKEFLFQVDGDCRFALYDPVAAKTKIFKIKLVQQFDRYKIFEYVDSLVWIASASKLKLAG